MSSVDFAEMAVSEPSKFWDRLADRYAKKPVADEAAYHKKLEITRTYFRPDMEVLEFGCGTGSTAIAHAPYVTHIRAIDFSSRMVEIAQGKADAGGVSNVTFERSTLDALNAPDGSYDAIMGHSILHLLDDRDEAIAQVHRLLKPGGIFVSTTACIGDFMGFFKVIAPIGKFLGVLPLVKVFTKRDLRNSLTATGFSVDHEWQPGKRQGVFIVAKKAASA